MFFKFDALGAPINVRTALIIGGENITNQGIALSRRPHIVIATPGRLRHHLQGPDPPNLSRTKFIILDEADRLLSAGFESELRIILSCLHPNRQTLLFSATMNSTLMELEKIAMKDTLKFDLTKDQKIPTNLIQEYLFMPAQVKLCYLIAILNRYLNQISSSTSSTLLEVDDLIENKQPYHKNNKKSKKRKYDTILSNNNNLPPSNNVKTSSVIIFVGSCKKCQETAEILHQLHIDCVALHSILSQPRRRAALGKFKSQTCRVLVATDLASRGISCYITPLYY